MTMASEQKSAVRIRTVIPKEPFFLINLYEYYNRTMKFATDSLLN
jgi:hypothetical protein